MRKKFGILAVAVALVALFVGSAMAGEIKIGYLAALTGDYAGYGQTELRAAQLAVEEINAKGGVLGNKLVLVPYDWRTRAEDAVNAVRRMIDQDKVVAIIGANASGANIATAPIVNKAKVPQIGTVSTNPLVTVDEKGKVRPYSFRICFTDPYQGKVLANLAAVKLGKKKGAMLYDVASDYSQGLREFCIKEFEKLGGKIVADEAYKGTDTDFRAQLTNVRNSGADVLFLPGMGKDMALIIKQARELGMKDLVIMGGDGYADFMYEIAGNALVGTYWVNHTSLEDPGMQPFFKAYKEKYKDECKEFVNGVLAYDSVYWLADAIKRAGKVDGTAIAQALEKTKDLKLHHAVLSINPKDHNPLNKTAVILRVEKDGKAHFFTRIQPK
ncbi:Extracellular ligand-binding receptor [Thermanaerovibrio acidaminovorans DSM 6589]|uniref:Extracellular ligand-binding receptor n=1 Tax=Thermanaerovibrio acidaminovorans (strain ATCC 49978 / DSM 6589 / Su883) TaxID=525903 RepID=D1B9T5_THEAS|nr:ABC transporter substrate-binding protein [Thermanaerovibrio acidaminovorans]ACZ19038.1 Extracellular ligand-binding receptor [Thermanaerovibrio acidaminovorans DSM 6589]